MLPEGKHRAYKKPSILSKGEYGYVYPHGRYHDEIVGGTHEAVTFVGDRSGIQITSTRWVEIVEGE